VTFVKYSEIGLLFLALLISKGKCFWWRAGGTQDPNETPSVGCPTLSFFCMNLIGKKGHNVLTLMLDLRFGIIWLVISYVGHKNASILVGDYDNCYCCPYSWSITSCWCPMWLKGYMQAKTLFQRTIVLLSKKTFS
jgi:hypothetical protein